MIVQCKACATRYYLDEEILGSKGCRVRCMSCKAIWVEPPRPLSKQALVLRKEESVKPGSFFLKALHWNVYTKIFTGGLILLGIVMVVHFASLEHMASIFVRPFQDSMVISPLQLRSFSYQRNAETQHIVMQGELKNTSKNTIASPSVWVLFFQQSHSKASPAKIIKKIQYTLHDFIAHPDEKAPFSFSLPDESQEVSFISVIPNERP